MTKAERTRAFIIEKTAPVFNIKGYAGTSINDLTEATGLTKGSIYGNFNNKEEVAFAAFDYNVGRMQTIITREVRGKAGFREKLLVYPEIYSRFNEVDFIAGGCPILNTAVESDDTHPELKARAAAALQTWRKSLITIIEKGKAAGEFAAATDAGETALTIIAMIEGAMMISKVTGRKSDRTSLMNALRNMIAEL